MNTNILKDRTMRKTFFTMILAALMLPMVEAAAQGGNKIRLDSIVKPLGLVTTALFGEDYGTEIFISKELRAGMINDNIFVNAGSSAGGVELPSDRSAHTSLFSIYGTKVWDNDADEYMEDIFSTLEDFFEEGQAYTDSITNLYQIALMEWLQGGVYNYKLKIPGMNIDKNEEVVIRDVPNMRKTGRTSCKVGSVDSLSMLYIFNTGYPYSQDTLKAENKVKFQLFSVDKDNHQKVIDEREKTFSLLDREKPLVACIDTVAYDGFGQLRELGPGEWFVSMSCDWNNIERIMNVTVNDTLRAEMKLDKDLYVQGEDKKAKVSFKMDYGYPYINAVDDEQLPTVRFFTKLNARFKDDVEEKDSTYTDSLIVADSKFAEEHVYLEKEVEIDLDNLLSHYVFENDVDTLSLNAIIIFEGSTQKDEKLKLLVKRNGTSVTSISTDNDGPAEYYNLNGQRITAPNDKRQLYIEKRNGKAVVRVRN